MGIRYLRIRYRTSIEAMNKHVPKQIQVMENGASRPFYVESVIDSIEAYVAELETLLMESAASRSQAEGD